MGKNKIPSRLGKKEDEKKSFQQSQWRTLYLYKEGQKLV